MAQGIRDKVVILGMGCSRFGERWDCSGEDLMLEAFQEALADAEIARDQIEAAWFGLSMQEQSVSKSALSLSHALRLPNIAATRVENLCAARSMLSRPVQQILRSRWESRSLRTRATVACLSGQKAPLMISGSLTSPRPVRSLSSQVPTRRTIMSR